MPKYEKPYIDASVWLGWKNREIRRNPETGETIDRHEVFQSIWEAAQRGEFKLYTSSMTFAEVYKLRHEQSTQPLSVVEGLLGDFEEPWVEIIELDREVGITANQLCRQFAPYKLYPNDAIHLASALRVPCDYLLAYDRPLNSVPHSMVIIDNPRPVAAPFNQLQSSFGDFSQPVG